MDRTKAMTDPTSSSLKYQQELIGCVKQANPRIHTAVLQKSMGDRPCRSTVLSGKAIVGFWVSMD
jgi:hypothetical protein